LAFGESAEGNNCFKLRDLADLLGFRAEWDEANKTIVLETQG
jgi:hypothetical protein